MSEKAKVKVAQIKLEDFQVKISNKKCSKVRKKTVYLKNSNKI
jgi:hypothetical protein